MRDPDYSCRTRPVPLLLISWWRHYMETFSASLAICVGIHRSPVNSLHQGQWRGALMFSLICAWINRWVNYGKAGDLRRHRAHYDVIVMIMALVVAMPSAATMLTMWNGNHPVSLESEFRQLETFRCEKIILNTNPCFCFPEMYFGPVSFVDPLWIRNVIWYR